MAYNSTIRTKSGICSMCTDNKEKPLTKGLCGTHYWAAVRMKSAEKRDTQGVKNANIEPKRNSAALQRWFEDRHLELTGKCWHCGGKSCKGASNYKCSIAHILPKRLFKSVATHPLNWIELCFWGNSCHTNLDQNTLDIIDLNCFSVVIDRFVAMYPDIDTKERKFIPDLLLQYVKIDSGL